MRYAELQIELRPKEDHSYAVEILYKPPSSEAEVRPPGGVVHIDPEALLQTAHPAVDPARYGQALTRCLFEDRHVHEAFVVARDSAKLADVPLRLRLLIHAEAFELNRVRWETLRDPKDDSLPLCADRNLFLSRYSLTEDYRPVHLRYESQLRALVMVANPSNLDPEQVAPIDVEREVETARNGLGPIFTRTIPDAGSEQRATLENLIEQLNEDRYDIVYLVCHGRQVGGETRLYLEDDAGELKLIEGRTLEAEFNGLLEKRPSLVILASCQSADEGEGEAFTAIGPRLAQAGVPAVIAMQDRISMETNAEFISVFFEVLQRQGVVDKAITEARWRTKNRSDFWMPALYTRLRTGRIVSGFSDKRGFNKWPVLTAAVEDKTLVPILGPGLVEPIIGSLREIAREWAGNPEHVFPMFDYERDSLPQVAQFWADQFGMELTKKKLEKSLIEKLQTRHESELPAELLENGAGLDEIISKLAAIRRERAPWDVYKVLAQLALPIYVSANFNRVLESALEDEGKDPLTLISPWNEYVRNRLIDETETEPDIDADRPLVFHPFGRLNDPDTVVLTEDEYFEYLIAMGSKAHVKLLPPQLPEKLVRGTLLFLGFHLVDWDLRVLLQTLFSFGGKALLRSKKHIAVIQVDREGLIDLAGARDYLRERLRNWSIFMYVGSPEDFVNELLYYLPAEVGGRGS